MRYKRKQIRLPQILVHKRAAYLPLVNNKDAGTLLVVSNIPKSKPAPTERKKLILGAGSFQSKNIGAKPITMVPLMVVADKMDASKNTGIDPKSAIRSMVMRPAVTVLPIFKSMTNSLAVEAKVESKVDAA